MSEPAGSSAATAATAAARRGELVEAATALGARICRDALWFEQRCNWIGPSVELLDGDWRDVHKAYGPDLYSGTSGIALFLARLHRVTGERLFRRTALGAIRNALERAQDVEPVARIGCYNGWVGLAEAAIEIGWSLDEPPLRDPALALLSELSAGQPELEHLDVLAGCAGAIPSLLRIRALFDGPSDLLELAVALGEHLIERAVKTEVGWSWGEAGGSGTGTVGNMTGFSHGAGGIGWGLLELWAASDEERFRHAAEQAFRYERHWFDEARGNWPDLRAPEASGAAPAEGPAFMSAWCHGAPGIGLSRVRASLLLDCSTCRREAEAAIETTLSRLVPGPEMSQNNYSLCHGISGNCDLLIYAADALGRDELYERAAEAALRGIETHARQRLPWPCGTRGSVEVPGLMLGLAGIGYFFLRLADPIATPSVLIRVPEAGGAEQG